MAHLGWGSVMQCIISIFKDQSIGISICLFSDHPIWYMWSRGFLSLGPPIWYLSEQGFLFPGSTNVHCICLVPLFNMRASSRGTLSAEGTEVVWLRVCQIQSFLTQSFSFFTFSVPPHQANQSVSPLIALSHPPSAANGWFALLACVCEWMALIAWWLDWLPWSWYGERISTDQTLDRRRRIVAVNVVVTLNIMKSLNYHVKVSKMIINVLIWNSRFFHGLATQSIEFSPSDYITTTK